MINDDKLKRFDVSRISPSGGSAGEGVVISDAGTECEFGTVSSAGGGGGGGYTGFHDYGDVPTYNQNFTGDFSYSFSSVNVTGDIAQFVATGMSTGNSLLLKVTCPTGNHVTFHPDIAFIGERPDVFPSGKTGMLVLTCFDAGLNSIIAGYAEQD